jgi:FkbM family methyltransferase
MGVLMSLTDAVELKDGWLWPKGDNHTWDAVWREVRSELPELLALVPRRRVVVQAGGNGGIWVRELAAKFERVYTYEPDPINFRCLVHNCPFPNVVFTNGAVGDRADFLKMKHHPGNPGAAQVEAGEIIPVHRIDSLNLDACNLLQLDIEGFEHEGLRGAERTILRHKPVICLEMQKVDLAAQYGSSNELITAWLAERGYKLHMRMHMDNVFVPD